jgi:hypothetical protein
LKGSINTSKGPFAQATIPLIIKLDPSCERGFFGLFNRMLKGKVSVIS